MIGRKLSHFRILDRIGEGGMGLVYRAEDENLHREVALKVLPPEAVANEERRLRFLREARAAASVTHPNIATIHEVDEADGVVFIAMELIEGKTLREVIAGKPLSLKEALRLGIEIGEGLARAHQGRVVHRDLKPDNVMVASDGHVKILDFGLAKLLESEDHAPSEHSRLETISGEMTERGRVMGTASYMSPEQARGQTIDSRSDLFAFGIVLYEMVTGKVPFRGPTPLDTLSAILRAPVAPASQTNPEVPQELDRIVGKCLEKDPAERYQDTRDLVVDLKRLKRDSESQPLARLVSGPGEVARDSHRRLRGRMLFGIAVLLALAGGGYGAWRFWRHPATSAPPSERLVLSGEEVGRVDASLSPDGKSVAFSGKDGLFVRDLTTGATRPLALPAGEIADGAAWSPDGSRIYTRGNTPRVEGVRIWEVSVLTGATRQLRDGVTDGPWTSPDGKLLAFLPAGVRERELWVMDADGGSPRQVLSLTEGNEIRRVAWAPNGRRLAFHRVNLHTGWSHREVAIETCDLTGAQRFVLISDLRLLSGLGGTGGLAWLPDGRLFFSLNEPTAGNSTNVWSLRVDPDSGRAVGSPARITSGLGATNAPASYAADGKRILFYKSPSRVQTFVGRLSPDGRRLDEVRQFSHSRANTSPCGWTHDGRVLVLSDRNGPVGVFVQGLDSREPTVVVSGVLDIQAAAPGPDGTEAFYVINGPEERKKNSLTVMLVDLTTLVTRVFHTFKDTEFFDYPQRNGLPWVLSDRVGGDIVFSRFDLEHGKGPEFARLPVGVGPDSKQYRWVLSPDGARLALTVGKKVFLVDVPGGRIREIAPDGAEDPQWGSFTADGTAMIVSWGSALFRVELDGHVTVLRKSEQPGEWIISPFPSRDGRLLAFAAISFDRDVLLMENF